MMPDKKKPHKFPCPKCGKPLTTSDTILSLGGAVLCGRCNAEIDVEEPTDAPEVIVDSEPIEESTE
jgi:transcription elongation factor Elf1